MNRAMGGGLYLKSASGARNLGPPSRAAVHPREPVEPANQASPGIERALLAAAAAAPALVAAAHAPAVADAAHDGGTVRALGLGWTGALRALDAPVAGLLAWVPVGTRALRAELATAAICGLAAAVVFVLALRACAACAEKTRLS